MDLPGEIYSVESVRNIDRAAIDGHGIGGYTLMTRAGAAALETARARFPHAKRWQVVCGSGNNGGDGYVVARLAAEQGIAVSVLALAPPDKLSGDAATAYMDFAALDVREKLDLVQLPRDSDPPTVLRFDPSSESFTPGTTLVTSL